MINQIVFPCWETPGKCFINSNDHNRRVGCKNDGSLYLTENRKEWEEWIIFPIEENQSDGSISCHFKSSCHGGRFLVDDTNGNVKAVKTRTDLKNVWYVTHLKTGDHKSRWLIRSKKTNRYLACDGKNAYTIDHKPKGWETWSLEFVTGELCFVKSVFHKTFISCSPFGHLCTKKDSEGWEVWRFIRLWDKHGSFLISSWTHTPKCLVSCPNGKVWSSDNRQGTWEKWTMEKAPDSPGVIIRSLCHNMVLRCKKDGRLYTSADTFAIDALWDIQAANKNTFCISQGDKYLVFSNGALTTKKEPSKETRWKLEVHKKSGTISLKSSKGRWLSVSEQDELYQVEAQNGDFSGWEFVHSTNGGMSLMSIYAKKYLSYNGNSFTLSRDFGKAATLAFQPVLPHTISMGQIVAISAAGLGALSTVVAAPFVVMGVIGALGFSATGITVGSSAAAMMSAEAIAGGGAVAAGGVVATLQSIGAAGLGFFGTTVAMGGGTIIGGTVFGSTIIVSGIVDQNNVLQVPALQDQVENNPTLMHNQPFCAWKLWQTKSREINQVCKL